MPNNNLMPISRSTLKLGKPLPCSVYNANGELLLSQGYVVETEAQIDMLAESGYLKSNGSSYSPSRQQDAPASRQTVEKGGAAAEEQSGQIEQKVALDEVRWQIGENFFLHQQGSSNRYTARLVGYVKNKTILVTMPLVEDKYVLVREGQSFVVRAFSGKKAYAFTAFVTKAVHTPFPYLHLSYPRELSCATIRHRARIPVSIISSISIEEQREAVSAILTDMSLGGASAVIKHPYGEIGQRGRLRFKISAVGETVLMDLAIILRSIAPIDNGGCRHGFEFVDLSTHDRLVLSAFFHQAEIER
jgi:c-di-GMP-binding flagellar brake protein YcgR